MRTPRIGLCLAAGVAPWGEAAKPLRGVSFHRLTMLSSANTRGPKIGSA